MSDNYFREIGRIFHKEELVEKVIISEKEKIDPRLEESKKNYQERQLLLEQVVL